jgi:hypothetical protein
MTLGPKKKAKQVRVKRKAMLLAQTIQETGKLDVKEAYRRYSPGIAKISETNCSHRMWEEGVMEELEKLLKVRDKDLLKKLTPEVIVQDIMDDLSTLNELKNSGKVTVEEIVKIMNTKGVKQKLLGMAVGLWKAEKPMERESTAGELLASLEKLTKENS